MSIAVGELTKSYGSQLALDHISFSVNKGEVLGLLGPNGAGKSTTMKILTGYILASSGSAEICGIDVEKYPLEVKAKIGYLPEHNPLYTDMFVREYLEFAAGLHGLSSGATKKRVEELIEKTGLTAERKKKIGQLSKGYRQRVGLAQALIHDPEVLILDEPTTGLDPNQIVEIRNLIRGLGESKTVILSTHIMQEVKAICQRAVIISRGKLVADERVEDIAGLSMQRKSLNLRFKEVYDSQWIKSTEGVKSTRKKSEKEIVLEIMEGHEDRIQDLIFSESARRKQVILSMDWEESSLEKVFQELTK
jgi:ABC-2 type transport system ATP-binding protein